MPRIIVFIMKRYISTFFVKNQLPKEEGREEK
jgi:hypothetical protein